MESVTKLVQRVPLTSRPHGHFIVDTYIYGQTGLNVMEGQVCMRKNKKACLLNYQLVSLNFRTRTYDLYVYDWNEEMRNLLFIVEVCFYGDTLSYTTIKVIFHQIPYGHLVKPITFALHSLFHDFILTNESPTSPLIEERVRWIAPLSEMHLDRANAKCFMPIEQLLSCLSHISRT